MSGTTNLTISNGGGPSITIGSIGSVSTVVATPESATSISVSTDLAASVSVSQQSSTSLSISTPESAVSVVKELENRLTVSTAIPSPQKLNLRDIQDVIGNPESGQTLIYAQGSNSFVFADQPSSGSGGSQVIDSAITVNNLDGAFGSINGYTYESGSSVTNILDQILNPYSKSSITLNHLKYYLENASGGFGSGLFQENDFSVEVGTKVKINGLNFTTSAGSQIESGSIELYTNGVVQSGYSGFNEGGVNNEFTSIGMLDLILEFNSPESKSFKLVGTDSGNTVNNIEYALSSGELNISWLYKGHIYTSPTKLSSSPTDVNFSSLVSDDSALASSPTSGFTLTSGSNSDLDSYWTYIAYPTSFGELSEIWLGGLSPISGDFNLVSGPLADGGFTYINNVGLSVSYYIYESTTTQVMGQGIDLKISF